MHAGILNSICIHGGASRFIEAKNDGRNCPMVDLHFRNHHIQAHHTQIPEENTIQNAVARVRLCSKIELSDVYFQTQVHPDDVKYNTIKAPVCGSTSQVMILGDMNAYSTCVWAMEDLFHEE